MALLDRIFREDVRIGTNGDPIFLTGSENVRSALEHRFSVYRASVPFLPNYGSFLKDYQSRTLNDDTLNRLRNEVSTQIRRDPRIRELKSVTIDYNQRGQVVLQVEIILINTNQLTNVEVII